MAIGNLDQAALALALDLAQVELAAVGFALAGDVPRWEIPAKDQPRRRPHHRRLHLHEAEDDDARANTPAAGRFEVLTP